MLFVITPIIMILTVIAVICMVKYKLYAEMLFFLASIGGIVSIYVGVRDVGKGNNATGVILVIIGLVTLVSVGVIVNKMRNR